MTQGPLPLSVVFDLDGTLVDTDRMWYTTRRELTLAHSGIWNDDAHDAMNGMNTAEWSRYMHETLGVALDESTIARAVIETLAARYIESVPVITGALELVEAVSSRFSVALATSSPRSLINIILQLTGWNDIFKVTISSDDVTNGKPAPDIYRHVLEQLGVPPRRAVAIEDSANGMRSARAAGMALIAVPRTASARTEAVASAQAVVSHLEAIDESLILSAIEKLPEAAASQQRS